jgi:hypothetical protein
MVNCVNTTNGIDGGTVGAQCQGDITLQLTAGGVITSAVGVGLQANTTSNNTGTAGLYGMSGNGSGNTTSSPAGIWGDTDQFFGVVGTSVTGTGVYGSSVGGIINEVTVVGTGVVGTTINGISGVYGQGSGGTGVTGQSYYSYGVSGISDNSAGVFGQGGGNSPGVYGQGAGAPEGGFFPSFGSPGPGVLGYSNAPSSEAVTGYTDGPASMGVAGYANQPGPGSYAVAGLAANGALAGYFSGNVLVMGTLSKAGGGFKIDHPLEPASKYLYHSFVESSEMKNVYDGVAVLDSNGEIEVGFPAWFEALNRDFRYQLTPLGAPAPNLHIAQKVSNGQFKIAGGQPGQEVSWQVTGIRKDPWAQANSIGGEEEKSADEQGYYLHPELYNQPVEKGVEWVRHPEIMHRLDEKRHNPPSAVDQQPHSPGKQTP